MIKDTFKGAQSKDDVSLFSLPNPAPETLHLILDAALAGSAESHPFRVAGGKGTVFLTGQEIKTYLSDLKGGEGEKGLRVIDFTEFKKEGGGGGEVKKEEKEKKQPAAPIALVTYSVFTVGYGPS